MHDKDNTPERDFACVITETLSRKVKVRTNDYVEEKECDEDGSYFANPNTEYTNWPRAYNYDGHYTLIELLNELEYYVKRDMEESKYDPARLRYKQLENLLNEVQGWTCEESNIELD